MSAFEITALATLVTAAGGIIVGVVKIMAGQTAAAKIYSDILGKRFINMSDAHDPGGAFGRLLAVDRYGHLGENTFKVLSTKVSRRRLNRWLVAGTAAAAAGTTSLGFLLGWW